MYNNKRTPTSDLDIESRAATGLGRRRRISAVSFTSARLSGKVEAAMAPEPNAVSARHSPAQRFYAPEAE